MSEYLIRPIYDHRVVELWGVKPQELADGNLLVKTFKSVSQEIGLEPRKVLKDEFDPGGFTILFSLAASHLIVRIPLVISTYPEEIEGRYMHIDAVSCREVPLDSLKDEIAKRISHQRIEEFKVNYPDYPIISSPGNCTSVLTP